MSQSILVVLLSLPISIPMAIWTRAPWYGVMAIAYASMALVRAAYL